MPLPALLIPLLMAAGGAGIGALSNKKNRGKGALIGAGLGALGGAGLGAMGVGAGAAAGSAAGTAGTAASTGAAGLKGMQALKYAQMFGPMMGALGGGQQEEQLPPMFPMPQPMMPTPLNQSYARPMAPPVQTSFNPGGYYG